MSGYWRIDIPGHAADRQSPDDAGHGQTLSENRVSGRLLAQMRTARPVHVGTGDLLVPTRLIPAPQNPQNFPLVAPFFREAGRLCIPGSSIKGAFRHLYEMVTASCLAQADTRTRGGQPVGHKLESCKYRADSRWQGSNDLCPACRVFGAMGYLGRVFFHPVYPEGEFQTKIMLAPQRWSPRIPEQASRKLYTHEAARGDDGQVYEPKEPLEALSVGVELQMQMDFSSLLPEELGLLLLLMGLEPGQKIYPKLGGVKAHGWGAVNIYDAAIESVGTDSYLDYERVTSTSRDLQPYFESLERVDLLRDAAWRQVLKQLGSLPEVGDA